MSYEERFPLLELGARVGFTRHIGGIVTTRMLAARCGLRPGLRVLEVGCGTGRTAAHLAGPLGCDVVACDVSGAMLDWARGHLAAEGVADRVELVQADATDLPWENGRFDAVVCESVLVFVDDVATAVREMVRTTRPGGVVGLNEGTLTGHPVPESVARYADDALGGVTFAAAQVWEQRLVDAGLQAVSTEPHPFRTIDELRTIVGWIGVREYLTFVWRLLRVYRKEPDLRDLIADALSAPRHVTRHMGAGIYVGRVGIG